MSRALSRSTPHWSGYGIRPYCANRIRLQCVSAFRLGLTTCVMFRRKRSRLSPTRSHYIWHERTAKSSCLTCAVLGDFAFACFPKCPNGATILRCHRGVFSGLLYRPAVTSFCSRNHADCPWDAVLEQINRDWCRSIQFSPALYLALGNFQPTLIPYVRGWSTPHAIRKSRNVDAPRLSPCCAHDIVG